MRYVLGPALYGKQSVCASQMSLSWLAHYSAPVSRSIDRHAAAAAAESRPAKDRTWAVRYPSSRLLANLFHSLT